MSVWTTDDETVTPPESAELDGALNVSVQSVCPNERCRHGDLPDDPVVQAVVAQALGTAEPKAPTVDCVAASG